MSNRIKGEVSFSLKEEKLILMKSKNNYLVLFSNEADTSAELTEYLKNKLIYSYNHLAYQFAQTQVAAFV